MSGPAVLQDINKATGYTPNLGVGGGPVYQTPGGGGGGGGIASGTPAPSAGPDYSAELAAIAKQNSLLQNQLNAQYTPYFNTYQNYLSAQNQAAGAVNPLYTAQLNNYLSQEAQNKARKQADVTTAQQQIQEGLGDTLAHSATQRGRTAEDTQTNLDQIANTEQNYQQDQGTAFDKARLALLRGSQGADTGLGAQAVADQQTQRNTTEGRQVQSYDTQKAAQNLFKTRTFEDLATSDTIAGRKAGEQTTATNLDLNRYIQDLQSAEADYRNQQNLARLNDIASQTQAYERTGVQKFLSTLSGQGAANAAKAYL